MGPMIWLSSCPGDKIRIHYIQYLVYTYTQKTYTKTYTNHVYSTFFFNITQCFLLNLVAFNAQGVVLISNGLKVIQVSHI